MARKYTSPYYQVFRAQVILLVAEGLENKEIGDVDVKGEKYCPRDPGRSSRGGQTAAQRGGERVSQGAGLGAILAWGAFPRQGTHPGADDPLGV